MPSLHEDFEFYQLVNSLSTLEAVTKFVSRMAAGVEMRMIATGERVHGRPAMQDLATQIGWSYAEFKDYHQACSAMTIVCRVTDRFAKSKAWLDAKRYYQDRYDVLDRKVVNRALSHEVAKSVVRVTNQALSMMLQDQQGVEGTN